MGINVAFVGNPNVGKTSIYNNWTHSFEHIGNWPGVTVTKIAKKIEYEGENVNFVDLPGIYSLTIYSFEEAVTRDSIYKNNYDLIINVCEVNNLSRNLYLTLQLLERNENVALIINMIDELKYLHKKIDFEKLKSKLNLEIIPLSAKKDKNHKSKIERIINLAKNKKKTNVILPYLTKLPLDKVAKIIERKANISKLDPKWCAIKLLENDEFIYQQLNLNEHEIKQIKSLGNYSDIVASLRYEYIDKIMQDVVTVTSGKTISQKLDKILINKYLSIPIFFLIMLGIFFLTFSVLSKPISDLISWLVTGVIHDNATLFLHNIKAADWLNALICDGIIDGTGVLLAFLPQVVFLFLFLSLLEDSGYINRVAFVTDGIFRKIGLSGRSVFTMLMGFGCSATAILTSKGLDDENMRKKTVLITPFMSCSARLPIYTVIGSYFFGATNTLIIFMFYLMSIIIAILLAYIFEKYFTKLKSGDSSLILEMFPYKLPSIKRVYQLLSNEIIVFISKIGTLILSLTIFIYFLSHFTFTLVFSKDGNNSIFQLIGSFISPIFKPLGFASWQCSTALLGGLIAKETVVSIIESLGGVAIFAFNNGNLAALSFMTFCLLYVPCVSSLAAIGKEIGKKFILFSLILHLVLAYFFSLLVYQIGKVFIVSPGFGITIILAIIIFLFACLNILKHFLLTKQALCEGSCISCPYAKTCNKQKKDTTKLNHKSNGTK